MPSPPAPACPSAKGDLLLVGAGYLAPFLVPKLVAAGWSVTATRRSPARLDELRRLGAHARTLDLADLAAGRVDAPLDFRCVVYTVAAGAGGDRELCFVEGPALVARAVGQLERFVLTSSTGVYPQDDGSWVDETSATEPTHHLVRGEVALARTANELGVGWSALRLAGLYGPGRSPVDWVRDSARRASLERGAANGWMNWLHADDAATALTLATTSLVTGPFVVSDGEPIQRGELYARCAALASVPALTFGRTDGLPHGKRCKIDRARAELGYAPTRVAPDEEATRAQHD